MSHRRRKDLSYSVSDPSGVSPIIRAAIGRCGSALAAARKALGHEESWGRLSSRERRAVRAFQQTLNRWATKGAKAVQEEKRMRALRLLTAEEAKAFDALLLPSHVCARLARYTDWRREQLRAEIMDEDDVDPYLRTSYAWDVERERVWKAILQRHRGLAGRLVLAMNRVLDEERARIAERAVLDPLLQYGASGGIERHWSELTPAEFRRYLKGAIQAQEVLLNRPAEIVRAQETPRPLEAFRLPHEVIGDHPGSLRW
jgi:hypothetical protein